jgi:hypothetical protein
MSERRGHWYLLTGLLIGLVLGVGYAWVLAPVEFIDTTPDSLRADFKDEYRYLIAASYHVSGNLERASARLTLLGDPDPAAALGAQAQRMLAANAPAGAVRLVAELAEAMLNPALASAELPGEPAAEPPQSPPVASDIQPLPPADTPLPTDATSPFEPILAPTETPSPSPTNTRTATPDPRTRTPTPTNTPRNSPTPIPTATIRPSLTPTATPGLPFQLVNQSTFCDSVRPGLLQVVLENAAGNPASGIEITITWLGGEETFYTGLKPELGFGYADFTMTPDIEYALSLSGGVTRVSGLQTSTCNADTGDYPGSIRLEFRQP